MKAVDASGVFLESTSNRNNFFGCANSSYNLQGFYRDSTEQTYNFQSADTDYHSYKITKEGTTVKYYFDGTLKQTITVGTTMNVSRGFNFRVWQSNKSTSVKNVKIKAL